MVKRFNNITTVYWTEACGDPRTVRSQFSRFIAADYKVCGGVGLNPPMPEDRKGRWLIAGDYNGISSRSYDGYTPDIIACAEGILQRDNNCYSPDATETAGVRTCKKSGMQAVAAKKIWQGGQGFMDLEPCTPTPSASAPQLRYRSLGCTFAFYAKCKTTFYDPSAPDLITHLTGARKNTVNRTSGVVELVENSLTVESDTNTGSYDVATDKWTIAELVTVENNLASQIIDNGGVSGTTYHACLYNPLEVSQMGASFISNALAAVPPPKCSTVGLAGFDLHALVAQASQYTTVPGFDGPVFSVDTPTHCAMTQHKPYSGSQDWSCEATLTNTQLVYNYSFAAVLHGTDTYDITFSVTWELSDPYTAADLDADWAAAADSWDLSDWPLNGSLRSDGQMANVPICYYNEIAGDLSARITTVPALMDDYSDPISDGTHDPWTAGWTPTFGQTDWLDLNDFRWLFTVDGHDTFNQPDIVDGVEAWTAAKIIGAGEVNDGFPTHFYDGSIISHNPAGYSRHFWFGMQHQLREKSTPGSTNPYSLTFDLFGYPSTSPIPEVALRWMTLNDAQYDSLVGDTAESFAGNMPYFWKRQIGNYLIGVKQVNSKEVWNSVNFARPYGKDLWAVDQTTVCVFTEADGDYTITPTIGATAPVTDDWVMIEGYGVTQATVIAGVLTPYGTPIPIPTGCDFPEVAAALDIDTTDNTGAGQSFLGKMRWWGKPPFGLLACAGVYDAGSDQTTFTIPATPYWTDVGSGLTQSVDLYDADAGNGNPHNLITTVTLTKALVGDLTATCDGDQTAAKYLIPHDMLPWWDDTTPKGDFVKVYWTFNARQAALEAATSVSTVWLGGTVAGTGVLGCLTQEIADANIKFTPCCPAMVGGVVSDLEQFKTQELMTMPTLAADASYGTYYQGMVATTMTDPFWQAPFNPVGDVAKWTMDDGSGHPKSDDPDAIRYYPHAPLVEARASLPTNGGWAGDETAPALAGDCTLEYDPATNVHLPPNWYGYNLQRGIATAVAVTGPEENCFTELDTDWLMYNRFRTNIAGSGRFSALYAQFVK